jgi:ankyrin repeat protein
VNAAESACLISPLAAAVTRAAALEGLRRPQAAAFGRCVQLLLEAGADPGQAARDGMTPLHAGSEGGSVACVEALLAAGAALEAADAAGRTPLAGAAAGRSPHPRCVLHLLARGAEVASPELVGLSGGVKAGPLHCLDHNLADQ